MQTTIEPLELSNIYNAGIRIPNIDKNVTMFMLCHDSPICVTRSASTNPYYPNESEYYIITNGYINACYLDDLRSDVIDIDTTFHFFDKQYLSSEDRERDCDVAYLLTNMEDKIPNWFMKIKNIEFDKKIKLSNGQNVIFSKQKESLVVYFNNVYLDHENQNQTITLTINDNARTPSCTDDGVAIKLADEFWIAFYKPPMSKNARNI